MATIRDTLKRILLAKDSREEAQKIAEEMGYEFNDQLKLIDDKLMFKDSRWSNIGVWEKELVEYLEAGIDFRFYHTAILNWAGTKKRNDKGWKRTIVNWFARDRKDGKLVLITDTQKEMEAVKRELDGFDI